MPSHESVERAGAGQAMTEFGLRNPFRWLRIENGFAARMLTAVREAPRGPIALWITTSCLLLALAGGLQFRWMSQSKQSQQLSAQESLDKSVRLAIEDLEFKVWLLLGVFRSDPLSERDAPVDYYRTRLYMWHELSQHGPAVERLLVYDTRAGDSDGLTELELFLGPDRFSPAPWEADLVEARQYIQRHGFPPGRGVKSRWTATWMFHPGAMVLMRPIVADVPSSRRRVDWPAVIGYLMLKLDSDYIRERLVPDTLNDRFGTGPRAYAYRIDVALDGKPLFRWVPLANPGHEALDRPPVSYSHTLLDGDDPSIHPGPPDEDGPLLLSQARIPVDVVPLGVAQRVWVHTITDPWRLDPGTISVPPSIWSNPLGRGINGTHLGHKLRQSSGIPRLFVIGDEKHRLALEARHPGIPLTEAIDREHRFLLAVAGIAFLLLVGVAVIVALTKSSAARTAELRTDAAASLAHQLLTPITAVSSIGDNIARGMLGRGEKAIEYGGLIHRYGQRLQTIVDRAMQMSAMDSFERRYELTMLDVSKVAQDALDDLRFLIEDAGFTAESALATDLPNVRADVEALQQTIADLIGNAVKYGLPGRWLKVETALGFAGPGREVLIRVHDRGPGIPARDASRIFEPYYRIDNRISKSSPGAGLGLKLVVELVKGMGGRVTLDTEEGRGSVFTIHLPAAAP